MADPSLANPCRFYDIAGWNVTLCAAPTVLSTTMKRGGTCCPPVVPSFMAHSKLFPHPTYTQTVLKANFDDARQWFLEPLLAIHRAHAVMLTECGILPAPDAASILGALQQVDIGALANAVFDGSCEDFFFHVESLLSTACGPSVAGKLHTARSRNDVDITLYRMVLRREVLAIGEELAALRRLLLSLARQHASALMPAYTHTQPAQPTTLGHYLAGVLECLERDHCRLIAAYVTVNRSPLGACAITTTGFPIDRHRSAELLGFDGLQENSIGAIAATDYVTESASAIAVLAINLGKFTQDLLLWCTQEFGFLRVGDAWAQISSIMPQKRNPVAFEHARMLLSRAFSQSQAVLTCGHNTPFGDIVDSEDDLWPLVFRVTSDAAKSLQLLHGTLHDASFNVARMAGLSGRRFITVTELADVLVREGGLSFAKSHRLVSAAVTMCDGDDAPNAIAAALTQVAAAEGVKLTLDETRILDALDPGRFVAVRKVAGGPALDTLRASLEHLDGMLQEDEHRLIERRDALAEAERKLASRCGELRSGALRP